MMVATRRQAELIVRDPRVQGGEPTVRGTRVTVRAIVLAHVRYRGDLKRIARAFTLDEPAVTAALAFYEANKLEIDQIIAENERTIAG
jgi:uncharacterized protein (DUF433 family)